MQSIINQRSKIEWTPYLATGVAEGFETANNFDETVEAWAYLIKTGLVWKLQGWFGRSAQDIIEGGSIDKEGTINWDVIDESLEQ